MKIIQKWIKSSFRFWFRIGVGVAFGGLIGGQRGWGVPLFFIIGVSIAITIDLIVLLILKLWQRYNKAH
jgi:hypothetical protein